MIDRIPPQSIDMEQAAIGSALFSRNAAEDLSGLQPDDYYIDAHRMIHHVITSLTARREPVDVKTVCEILRQRQQLDLCGGVSGILTLAESAPTAAHADYYRRIVSEKAVLRRLIRAAGEITDACYDGREVAEVTAEAERLIQAASSLRVGQVTKLTADMTELMEQVIDAHTGKSAPPGLSTGLRSLDNAFGGAGFRWVPGTFTIVGARPSIGKSSLCKQFCLNLALRGLPVLYVSLEESRQMFRQRLATIATPCDMGLALSGKLGLETYAQLSGTLNKLGGLPFYLDTQARTVAAIRSKCREIQRAEGRCPVLVVIDYLQLMETSGKSDNRNEALAHVTRGCKSLATDLDTAVVSASPLSRKVEERPSKRAMMSDLREVGAAEFDADIIIFPYRPHHYRLDSAEPVSADFERANLEPAEFDIAKNRMGPTGIVPTNWSTEYGGFELIDPYHEAPPDHRLNF